MCAQRIDKDQLHAMWCNDVPSTRIAEVLGVTVQAVYKAARRMGLKARGFGKGGRPRISIRTDPRFARMWSSEMAVDEIAATLGVSPATVTRAASDIGLPQRTGGRARRPDPPRVRIAGPSGDRQSCKPAAAPDRDPPFWTVERDAAVIATGGRYAKIDRLARKTGIPSARLLARWHVIRGRR